MKYHDFIALELQEINRHKWIESEKAGHDLGEAAVQDWVDRYFPQFREYLKKILKDRGEQVEDLPCPPNGHPKSN